MSRFLPLHIRFVDGATMVVSSIADAQKALACQWRNKEAATYNEAARLLSAAKDGVCKPVVAFEAFKNAAQKQGLLQPNKPSSALGILDDLTTPLAT